MSQRTKNVVGWILGLAYFVSQLGCGTVRSGIRFDSNTVDFSSQVSRMVYIQSRHFHDRDWPEIFAGLDVEVKTKPLPIPCAGINALGCTYYIDNSHPIIVQIGPANTFEMTVLAHELTHIYLCSSKKCDPTHSLFPSVWKAEDAAMNEYLSAD